jgi:hypothetical protein
MSWFMRKKDESSPVQKDLEPFQAAVETYLRAKSFGMKPVQLLELNVQGQTATVSFKLKDAEGTYQVAVIWTFTCQRNEQGGWTVTSHETQ